MSTDTSASEFSESNPFAALGDALESAASSIGDARASATADAKIAAAKVQTGVSNGAYYAAYGISYGLVFGGVFIKELLPAQHPVRRGFEDGAEAAFDAVARSTVEGAEAVEDEPVEEEAKVVKGSRKPD